MNPDSLKTPPSAPLLYVTQNDAPHMLSLYYELMLEYGDIVKLPGIKPGFLINSPDYVQQICRTNAENYTKNALFYRGVKAMLGDGLVTREGNDWLVHHKIIQPFFRASALPAYAAVITDATCKMAKRWELCAEKGQKCDLVQEIMMLVLDIAARVFFTEELSDTAKKQLIAYGHSGNRYVGESLFLAPWHSFPTVLRFFWSKKYCHQIIADMIAKRRQRSDPPDDLLTALLQAVDPRTQRGLTDIELRDEIKTFLMTGFETVGYALCWMWYCMARHPNVQETLTHELATVLQGKVPSIDDIAQLPYTHQVVKETLRLYPSIGTIARRAIAEDVLGEYRIPAQSMVMICPYTLHRHPKYWENPEVFDPDRFKADSGNAKNAYAYIPFATGARGCIASSFAMLELRLIIATLAQQFELEFITKKPITVKPLITLTPTPGMTVKVKKRM